VLLQPLGHLSVSLESAVYRLVVEPANPNCVANCARPPNVPRSLRGARDGRLRFSLCLNRIGSPRSMRRAFSKYSPAAAEAWQFQEGRTSGGLLNGNPPLDHLSFPPPCRLQAGPQRSPVPPDAGATTLASNGSVELFCTVCQQERLAVRQGRRYDAMR